jgi:hypothetical protein
LGVPEKSNQQLKENEQKADGLEKSGRNWKQVKVKVKG